MDLSWPGSRGIIQICPGMVASCGSESWLTMARLFQPGGLPVAPLSRFFNLSGHLTVFYILLQTEMVGGICNAFPPRVRLKASITPKPNLVCLNGLSLIHISEPTRLLSIS